MLLSLLSCAVLMGERKSEEEKNKELKIKEIEEHLLNAQELLARRDYEAALDEYQTVLYLSPRTPPEDEALFNMGLIYAHFGNPKKDYKKSVDLFLRVLNDHPESYLREPAKIWIGVLLESIESIQKVGQLKETIRDLDYLKRMSKGSVKAKQPESRLEEYGEGREHVARSQKFLAQGNYEAAISENQKILSLADSRSPKDEALFNLALIYAHSGNSQQNFGKSIEFFKTLIKSYPKSPLAEQAKIWVEILQENEGLNHLLHKLKQVDIEIEELKRKKTQ